MLKYIWLSAGLKSISDDDTLCNKIVMVSLNPFSINLTHFYLIVPLLLTQASVELRHKLEAQMKLNSNRSFRISFDFNCIGQVFNSILKLSAISSSDFDNEVHVQFFVIQSC